MTEHEVRSGFSGPAMLSAFILGAAAGAVAALLVAPASGTETRKRLGELARKPRELAPRVPGALQEASTAAKQAFTAAMSEKH